MSDLVYGVSAASAAAGRSQDEGGTGGTPQAPHAAKTYCFRDAGRQMVRRRDKTYAEG
jgi:hypothetical protein